MINTKQAGRDQGGWTDHVVFAGVGFDSYTGVG